MARLPKVGDDKGTWGGILNEFLEQSHDNDGTLKADTVGVVQLKSNAVTGAALANSSVSAAKIADGAVGTTQLADAGVTPQKLVGLGEPDGVASLDSDGRLPEAQVPERLGVEELNAGVTEIAVALRKDRQGRQLGDVTVATTPRMAVRQGIRSAAWSLNSGNTGDANMTNLAATGGVVSALTPGTEGRLWAPLFNTNGSCKLSATILATKATVGSYSLIQIADSALGTAPTAGVRSIGVGYVQGVGIVLRRSDGAFDKVLVADSAITDGKKYRVSFVFDNELRAGAPTNPFWYGAVHDAEGRMVAFDSQSSTSAFTNMGMLCARTTVANGIENLYLGQSIGAETGQPAALQSVKYTALNVNEQAALRVPAKPNGLLVVVLHGRGGSNSTMFSSGQYEPTWRLLLDAGYTLFMPNMHDQTVSNGNSWFSANARAEITNGVDRICAALNLDRTRIFLWGDSMGGGTALALIGNGDLGAGNVAGVYAAEPVCDIASVYAVNSGTFTEIPTLYPITVAQNAASPVNLPSAAYAGVPILFLASASDMVVPKTSNTDAMRTKLAAVTRTVLYPTTGGHAGNPHYNAAAALGWFNYAALA